MTPATVGDRSPTADPQTTLLAMYEGRVMGLVERARDGSLTLTYAPSWRSAHGAFPLSLSLPLATMQHGHVAVAAVVEAYLPDRTAVRDRLARDHGLSDTDLFGLLRVVGEDCPGAIQFVRPDRVDALASGEADGIAWLTHEDLVTRVQALEHPDAPFRLIGDAGYFSLAGAQAKIALYWEDGRWGVPRGRIPTTHILKRPLLGGASRFLVAELATMRLASALGLHAADVAPLAVGTHWLLQITRYDRVDTDGGWRRRHQEDLCQTLGMSPHLKYERAGAPGIATVVQALRTHVSNPLRDIAQFLDMIIFNWIVVGTDAHARNYSLMIGANGVATLAPFYDVASVLGVARASELSTARLAMQIGGEYEAASVSKADWRRLEASIQLPPDTLVIRVGAVAEHIRAILPELREALLAECPAALSSEIAKLCRKIDGSAEICARRVR